MNHHDTPVVAAGAVPPVRAIEFTASGSEYFRIWIVNLLLTLVTFGLYHPWAVVRRRRYFYGNTQIDGHAFDFHGDPRRMLRGYLLVAVFFALYGAAGRVSIVAAAIAGALLLALWPALFRASQRFRMANTSWRGLRFHFAGSLGGAYLALLPLLLPAVLVGVAATLATPAEAGAGLDAPAGVDLGIIAALALIAASAPFAFWRLKRYQHDHYGVGRHRSRLGARPGAIYALAFKTLGVGLLAGAAAFGLTMLAMLLAGTPSEAGTSARGMQFLLAAMLGMLLSYAAFFATVQPYMTSRLQNLLWSTTSARPVLRIDSRLRFRSAAALALKNFVLVICTLGLYWPFAAVAIARLRLEAVSVQVATERLLGEAGAALQDAAGDAAGDLFGIDVGL